MMRVLCVGLIATVTLCAAAAEPREVVLFEFEAPGGKFENSDKLQYVAEHVTQGERSGKIRLDRPFNLNFSFWGGSNMAGRWADFDQFVIDVFVGGGPVKCFGFVVADGKRNWWDRYNYEFRLLPGKRRLAFSLGAFVRQKDRAPLDLGKLDFFAIRFQSDASGGAPTLYLDNARLVKGSGSFEVKLLFGFEQAKGESYAIEDWPPESAGRSRATVSAEHATEGKRSLRLESGSAAGNVQFSGFDPDWSTYDSLAIDVFNAADRPLRVSGWIKSGSPGADWWNRHNYDRVLKPGFNCLRISTGGLTNPRHEPIDITRIAAFNVAVGNQTIFLDNVRLVKGVEEIEVKGIRKFDFGPANSAIMPGFVRVSKEDGYDKARGWGWAPGGTFGRDFDIMEMLGRHRPPDDLCRDFCMPIRATFAIDLPDGDYRVWLMQGPPGNGWGRHFVRRTVSAERRVVVDERYTAESFAEYEFQFQDTEDLPGDDLWTKYIDQLFRAREFDVRVADGQLALEFDGHKKWWTSQVNGLVVFPSSQAVAGVRWLAGLSERRKEQYEALHVEEPPPAPAPYQAVSAADRARGFVSFVHSPDRDIQVNSVPEPAEVQATLDLCASPGEYEDGCIGVMPLRACGRLTIATSDLSGPGGASIPASCIRTLVVRYKALNRNAVYTVSPKYMDAVPTEGIDLVEGVTRSFWLVVRVPADARAGRYSGTVELSSEKGGRDRLELALTVWPIALIEPEIPMGMFMMGPFVEYFRLSGGDEDYWKEWRRILIDAREHGLTSVDPLVSIPLTGAVGGRAVVDFSKMDRFMALARKAGFSQELNGYGIGTGFRFRNCRQSDADAARRGFADFAGMAKAYFDAVREHAEKRRREGNAWLPICFCTDDEYIVHPGGVPEKLAELHRTLQSSAPGFRFVAFDSVYLESKPGLAPAREKMLADIDTFGAGVHSPTLSGAVRRVGRRLWLYNTGMNRFAFGTYMFFARKKHGVEGFFQWIYPSTGTYTPHYLASHNEAHYGVVYPSRDGLRTTVTWERIRAGCDDHRYLETAWRLIETAKRKRVGMAQARALEQTIESTMRIITFGKPRANAFAGFGRADNPMSPERMGAFRRAVAEGIVRLQAAF